MDLYRLPRQVEIQGKIYDIDPDFRVILKIFRAFEDASMPPMLRWLVALQLFYKQEVAIAHRQAAMEYLRDFLCCGREETPGAPLFSWQQDAASIIAGVNAAAGQEVRALPSVHWWTFLGWFHAMPPGTFSTVLSLRQKLRKGQKLEPHEQEFYRENKSLVDLKAAPDADTLAEKERLNALLGE